MKKLLAMIICLSMLSAGCAGEGSAQIPNPMSEKASLDEINSAANTNIQRPGFDVTDESFFTITTDDMVVADYRFTLEGVEYTLRGANTAEDISGVYGDTGSLAIWYYGDTQYTLYCNDEDDSMLRSIAAEQSPSFRAVIEEIGEKYLLVCPLEGEVERNFSDSFTLPIRHMQSSNEPQVGDILTIAYDGSVMESYPAQLGQVYSIMLEE